jgi:radical SAM protein with 4Fe4S-binding SPASM domain
MRELNLLPFPQYLSIEITSKCNFRCRMCPKGIEKNSNKKRNNSQEFMEFSLWKKIIDEVVKYPIKEIGIVGYGENLLHPELIRFIKYAREQNIRIFLVTNGYLLDNETARKLIETEVNRIIFSVDAVSQEVYSKIKPGGNIYRVKRNIYNFLKLRGRSPIPKVQVQLLRMKENRDEIEDFVCEWTPVLWGNDCIYIKEVQDWAGQVSIDIDQGPPLSKLYHILEKKGIPVTHLQIEKWDVPEKRDFCRHLWLYCVIYLNGDVSVCCRDMYGLLKVGNIVENDIAEVWQSMRYQIIREMDINHRWDELPLCNKCRDWYKAK